MCSTYLNPGVAAWGLGATIICCSSLVFTAGYIILSVIASFFYMPELKQDSTDIVELSYHHQQEISNQAGKDGFDLLTKKYGVR